MRRAAWLIALVGSTASASDWRYAGRAEGLVAFYDAASPIHDGPRVRFWVCLVPGSELAPSQGDARDRERYAARVAAGSVKVAAGYVPPLLALPAVRALHAEDFQAHARRVATWEIIANDDVYATSRLEYEIDCARKTVRTSRTLKHDDDEGAWKPVTSPEGSRPIAPGTGNLALLAELLCPRRSR